MKPIKLRRLTKAEAKALGKSYGSKTRVDASVKRVTKSTKLYSDRQAAQLKLGKTKESYSTYRRHKNKYGAVTYRNVNKTEHFKLQKLAGMNKVQIIGFGDVEKKRIFGGSALEGIEGGSEGRAAVSWGFTGDELKQNLDNLYTKKGYLGFSDKKPPVSVNVIIYPEGHVF